jgi:protein-tyrosine phosphatase
VSTPPDQSPETSSAVTDLPARGFIDCHTHLLPGIDDGCETTDDAVSCIRRLAKAGYVGAVCTPHGGPPRFTHNTPDAIASRVTDLQQAVDEEGLDFTLLPGSELSLTDDLLAWTEDVGIQAMGHEGDARGTGHGAILFDYWGTAWTSSCDAFVDALLADGLTPVLAHPERMGIIDAWMPLLTSLTERGVLLQGNLRPLIGDDGIMAQVRAHQLVDLDHYALMCLDLHKPTCLGRRLLGLDHLRRGWKRKQVRNMLESGPRRLLEMGAG